MNTAVFQQPESEGRILHFHVDNRLQLRTLEVYDDDDDDEDSNSHSNLLHAEVLSRSASSLSFV